MRRYGSYKYEVRVVAREARGHKELQRKLQRLLNDGWDIDSIHNPSYSVFTIVATRKFWVKR